METQNTKTQGFISEVKIYFNVERGTLTHVFGETSRIELPIYRYQNLLGLPSERFEYPKVEDRMAFLGLTLKPLVYLSKDKTHIIHSFLGLRISKHVNYYKAIFEKHQAKSA